MKKVQWTDKITNLPSNPIGPIQRGLGAWHLDSIWSGPKIIKIDHASEISQYVIIVLFRRISCPISVILDESTLECFNIRRCGNRDILKSIYSSRQKRSGRKRRFFIPVEGEEWSPTTAHLTYDIVRYTEDLTPTVVDEAVRQAFKVGLFRFLGRYFSQGDELAINVPFHYWQFRNTQDSLDNLIGQNVITWGCIDWLIKIRTARMRQLLPGCFVWRVTQI